MKRIFIAMPCYQYVSSECYESIFNTTQILKNKYDFIIKIVSGYAVDQARNECVKEFLQSNCDYLLFIDSDIIISESAIEKLIESDKDIISAVYNHKHIMAGTSVIYKIVNGQFQPYQTNDIPEEVFVITACGFGCVLLKRDVVRKSYEKLKGICFKFDFNVKCMSSEDIYYCNELYKMGYDIYADGTAKVGHLGKFIY